MAAAFKQCGKLVVRGHTLFVPLCLVPWLVQVQFGQSLARHHGQHVLPSDTAVTQINVLHSPVDSLFLNSTNQVILVNQPITCEQEQPAELH